MSHQFPVNADEGGEMMELVDSITDVLQTHVYAHGTGRDRSMPIINALCTTLAILTDLSGDEEMASFVHQTFDYQLRELQRFNRRATN